MRFAAVLPFFSIGHIASAVSVTLPKHNDLQPWQISQLTTFSPSGRPGSSPWSIIDITISDPNDHPVVPTNCTAKWTFEEPPYNRIERCTEVPGAEWSFEMVKSESEQASPTMDFVLRFTLVREHETYLGVAKFVIGDNMRGLCSASGVCSFGLKEEMTPFLVNQARVV